MKKLEPVSLNLHLLKNQSEYYKNLGEKAAIYTFTRNSISQKHITPLNPSLSKNLHLKEDSRKTDNEITPLLSPLSRDISHLRDKLKFPGSSKPSELPSDIKSIKKLLETSDQEQVISNRGQSLPYICKKEFSVGSFQKMINIELPSIDKMLLGPPTGRQEISMLKKWFESMKDSPEFQENEENNKILHIMCIKELIRQVSVHCIERGELLHDILEYFLGKIEKNKDNLNVAIKNTEKIKKVVFDNFKSKENELREKIDWLEKKNFEHQEEIQRKNQEINLVNEMLMNERDKIEELKMKLGIEDLNHFRGLRMMHKSTNITSKTRDSLFRFNFNPKLKIEVEMISSYTQTEIVTYTRQVARVVKVEEKLNKVQEEGEILKDDEEENTVKINVTEDLKPEIINDSRLAPKEILKDEEKCEENPNSYTITVCDQECQTCFSLETIYYDYIEANVFVESDSLEEDFSDNMSDRRLSLSFPEDNLLEGFKLPNKKRKSSRIKRISLNIDGDKLGRNSVNTVDMSKYRKSNELEVIPDNDSSEEQALVENSDEKREKTLKEAKKTEENSENDRRKSSIPFRNFRKLSQTSSKSNKRNSSHTETRTNEIGQYDEALKELVQVQEKLKGLESLIQQKSSTLDYIQEQINKKKSILKSMAISPSLKKPVLSKTFRKLPTISINELTNSVLSEENSENHSGTGQKLRENQNELSENLSSSFNSSYEATNSEYLKTTIYKKSLTTQFLTPVSKEKKRNSLMNPNTSKNFLGHKAEENSPSPKVLENFLSLKDLDNFTGIKGEVGNPDDDEEDDEEDSGSKSFDDLIENLQETKVEKTNRKLIKKTTNSHLTEFALFQFGKKGIIKEQVRRNPAKKIISLVLTKKEQWIRKKAVISRKMTNKLMSTVYLSLITKPDGEDSLSEMLYDEFLGKYGIKNVADRKFTEFICSIATFEDSKRAKVFLRLIGAGSLANSSNFSQDSVKFYLNCLNFMINSKIGIMAYDDTQDKIMFPAGRAVECIKEKLYNFDRNIVSMVIHKIERIKINDPKKINATGLVEGEVVLETMAEVFENMREHVLKGVELIINALKYSESKDTVEKLEALMVFRIFCPGKVEEIEQVFLGKDCLLAGEFFEFCLEKCCLSINWIFSTFPDEKYSVAEVLGVLKPGIESLRMALNEIKAMKNVVWNEPLEFWEGKLKKLADGAFERDPYETLLAFKIYSSEISRVKNLSY